MLLAVHDGLRMNPLLLYKRGIDGTKGGGMENCAEQTGRATDAEERRRRRKKKNVEKKYKRKMGKQNNKRAHCGRSWGG